MTAATALPQRSDGGRSRRYVFFSHDGYGVGHLRRNCLIAHQLLAEDRTSEVTLVTGVRRLPAWSIDPRISVVTVPALVKDRRGAYRNDALSFEQTVMRRKEVVAEVLGRVRPHTILVDRHPFGIGGELRAALIEQRHLGTALVLGLRDVLDDPASARREMAGPGWQDVAQIFDDILIYGAADFCEHRREYGLPFDHPTYCGWVVERPPVCFRRPRFLTAAAGGGGDGRRVFELAIRVLEERPGWNGVFAAGPYADVEDLTHVVSKSHARDRVGVIEDAPGCLELFASSSAAMQMAGYNSTFEALAAGIRPILIPRWQPRREQLIRAELLVERDLADIVGENDRPETVARLLDRNRTQPPKLLQDTGIDLGGASVAAGALRRHSRSRAAA